MKHIRFCRFVVDEMKRVSLETGADFGICLKQWAGKNSIGVVGRKQFSGRDFVLFTIKGA